MKLKIEKKPKLKNFCVRLEPELISDFSKACKKSGVTVQSAVAQLLSKGLTLLK